MPMSSRRGLMKNLLLLAENFTVRRDNEAGVII